MKMNNLSHKYINADICIMDRLNNIIFTGVCETIPPSLLSLKVIEYEYDKPTLTVIVNI